MDKLILGFALASIAASERLPLLRFEASRFLRRGFATDLVYLATGALGLSLVTREFGIASAEALGALIPNLTALPFALSLALATVLYDGAAYASHLALHRDKWLWRVHKVHHSSPTLDWLATFRAHGVEHALRHLASTGLLLVLGFPVAAVAGAAAIHAAWAALGHSNLRIDLSFLEWLLITPRLHRLHHLTSTSERNLGTIFSVWDRACGNLVSAPGGANEVPGVPGEIDSYPQSWGQQLLEPFRKRDAVSASAPLAPLVGMCHSGDRITPDCSDDRECAAEQPEGFRVVITGNARDVDAEQARQETQRQEHGGHPGEAIGG